MRKETINTFSDGMSLDLNPLGTPAKTLTNCLNGTLITYNGNELTLQNDMGNAQVGTAALPKGYVPVGMKEYGGIIYVASYNPETKKGQLGCFPSPLLIYTSEAAQTIIDINIQLIFIDMIDDFPFIKLNEYKEEIFKDSLSLESKVFNSGDLFIIKTEENFSDLFRQALDENIITIKLLIIPKLGGSIIDLSDCLNLLLKFYDDVTNHKDLWIFLNGGNMYNELEANIPFDVLILEYPQYMQSYPRNIGPGILLILIEFNMFKLFNLYNKIEKDNNKFTVLFIGLTIADDADSCAPVQEQSLIPLSLIGNINYVKHKSLDQFEEILLTKQSYNTLEAWSKKYTLEQGQTLYYDLLPASKWGIADKTFLKSGKFTYNDILNYLNKISNWNFEINKSEVLIKWRFISLSDNIDHLRFVFIPLDLVLDNDNKIKSKSTLNLLYVYGDITENSLYVYKIVKPYFSGDFEDTFLIDSDHLAKNYIYLCRIDIIYKNKAVKNASDYKLLYTGTFFNNNDINQFNYSNRPEVSLDINIELQQNQVLLDKKYTIIKEDLLGINSEDKTNIVPSDIMVLAKEDNINKLIGVVTNDEYEVNSSININTVRNIKYKDKVYNWDNFSGNVDEVSVLTTFASLDQIAFNVKSNTDYQYNQEGDTLIEQCKTDYILQETVNGLGINNSTQLTFTKDSYNKFTNTSIIKIHRGILSKFGQPEDVNVVHLGLYPVYEVEDEEYNNQLFGFKIDEDFIYNCIYFKKNSLHNYLANINDWEALYDSNIYPYSENAVILGNSGLISISNEFDKEDIFLTILNMGNRPINICVTNLLQELDVASANFKFLLTTPHEISFSTKSKTGDVLEGDIPEHSKRFKKNNLGYNSYRDSQAFFRPEYTKNCMSILWRTQYGPRLINIATPINIENEGTEDNVIIIKKKPGTEDKFTIYSDNKKHTFSNMHLRAEKLLLCMLSLILITKCKNSTLRLNTPSTLYNTESFNNDLALSLNKVDYISLSLNGKDIEKAIDGLLSINVLNNEDIFIPKFKAQLLDAHLIIRDEDHNSKLNSIFNGAEYPYFSSVDENELKNIYPGKINSIENGYICKLLKNYDGTYTKNTSIIDEHGNFYKIFLPTLISEVNNPESLFNCTNTDTYKFILEGMSYNDILLPATRILSEQGIQINNLKSLDSDEPLFNLLYYNALTKQRRNAGAITLFGDLSAHINTANFNNSDDLEEYAPKLGWDAWQDVEILLDKKPESSIDNTEKNTEE